MDLGFGLPVLLTFFIAVIASILSGMSGGGGGFIIMPYYLFLGMPPANALATAKLGGIGGSLGAITAFRGKGLVHRRYVWIFMGITFVCALISAWLIPRLDPGLFTKVIGAALILLAPTLFIKKAALQPGARSRPWIVAGFICYTLVSFLQTLIGTGMGMILVLVLMFLFGLGALEASATKRVAQSVQAVLLFVLLSIQGLVMWWHGAALLAGSLVGSHIGTHMALKKGDTFVKVLMAGVMLVWGAVLLL